MWSFYLKNVAAKFQKYLKHISWAISGTSLSKLSCNPRHPSRNICCNHRHHLLQPSWRRIFSTSNNQKTRIDSDINSDYKASSFEKLYIRRRKWDTAGFVRAHQRKYWNSLTVGRDHADDGCSCNHRAVPPSEGALQLWLSWLKAICSISICARNGGNCSCSSTCFHLEGQLELASCSLVPELPGSDAGCEFAFLHMGDVSREVIHHHVLLFDAFFIRDDFHMADCTAESLEVEYVIFLGWVATGVVCDQVCVSLLAPSVAETRPLAMVNSRILSPSMSRVAKPWSPWASLNTLIKDCCFSFLLFLEITVSISAL